MGRGGGMVRAGGVYHLISRFTAKEWFIESALERRTYLSLLELALRETNWRCICYAVMSSHIHLGLVSGTCPLAKWLRPMHTIFAAWINERRERIGSVFVKGPKVVEFRPEATARLLDYVHQNPVRAGVVPRPLDTEWTSFRAYAGVAPQPAWLAIDEGLALAGFDSRGGWMEMCETRAPTSREELEAGRVVPLGRAGRPRKGMVRATTGADVIFGRRGGDRSAETAKPA